MAIVDVAQEIADTDVVPLEERVQAAEDGTILHRPEVHRMMAAEQRVRWVDRACAQALDVLAGKREAAPVVEELEGLLEDFQGHPIGDESREIARCHEALAKLRALNSAA